MMLRPVAVVAFLCVNNFSGSCAFLTHQNGSVQRRGERSNDNNIIIPGRPYRSSEVGHYRLVSTSSSNNENVVKEKPLEIMYPTKRGTTVDSREIIASGLARQNLRAVRLKHILFASEELAEASLSRVRSSELTFEELAQQISNCAETREHGGEVGWVNVDGFFTNLHTTTTTNDDDDDDKTTNNNKNDSNEHLDAILPEQARFQTFQLSTKPGDIIMATSNRGYHLVQIVDVMVDVRKMAQRKTRNKMQGVDAKKGNKKYLQETEQKSKLRGILGGALLTTSEDDEDDIDFGTKKKTNLTYKMETMGCQMNMADSERMEGQLQSLGLTAISEDDNDTQPDLVVLNTCSIRDHAEQKVYSYIGPYAKRKREGEDVAIIVAGCVAQQEGKNLLRRAPEVDLVMGPQYANRLADLLEDVSNGNQVVATEASHIMEDSTKPRRSSTVAAWVNVIYGCNERCSFCIVPTTRGIEQSRPVQSIVDEVTDLVQTQNYKEVTLLGQNIDAYGRDMIPKRKFSDLLRTVGQIEGLKRLRFVTSHPRYMSLGVIDAVAETSTACWNFHIPFQSGSDEVLNRMGRGHTRKKYLQIVDRIRERLPDAAITADVIVGFPGETDEQFEETLSLMRVVKFDSVNTAAYSPRPNTPAAEWTDQCSEETKQYRLRVINELNLQHAAERRARMMGRTKVEVLVEERNIKSPTQVMGRTTHGYIVYMDGDIDELQGKLVHVTIDDCQTYYLTGTITKVMDN